ncbi:MAG: N-acyl homoserine lactonase family protein [Bacilli bacterium]|jgi:glyoxylase-like metal-dependent hydrolase (beta-lactamase superfamily II)|nr:N-acyl homoserine lactonase family protein [Bacilli bacterium]MCI2054785.1 N-acyl homoserine lactonase family protein [Bacilli bacterium]
MTDLSVRILETGTVTVDKTIQNRGLSKNKLAFVGLFRSKKERITIPVKCFLITHPSGKRILVDAGWDSRVRKHPISTISFPLYFTSKPTLPIGEAVDEQLISNGVQPKDLFAVIMSHMDIDHASGLRLVKDSPKIYLSPEENEAIHSCDPRYSKKTYKGLSLTSIAWNGTYGPFEKSWDVFGDGSVIVFLSSGHSKGSLSIKVEKDGRFILVVGDSGYNEESWEKGYLPGPVYSKEEIKKTLAWIQEQRQKKGCVACLCAHDPSEKTKPQLIVL